MSIVTDPMIQSGINYSINRFSCNGVINQFSINFAGGYIRQSHVKAYVDNGDGTVTNYTLTFIGPNLVQTTTIPPNGATLVIYRNTPKDSPAVNFTDGAIINEPNLDTLADQAVFVAAEVLDRFKAVSDQANTATTLAQSAVATAGAAVITAGGAVATANGAVATATGAVTTANGAVTTANTTAGQFAGLQAAVNAIVLNPTYLVYKNVDTTFTANYTFSNPLTVAAPTSSGHAVTKAYADAITTAFQAADTAEVTARNAAISTAVASINLSGYLQLGGGTMTGTLSAPNLVATNNVTVSSNSAANGYAGLNGGDATHTGYLDIRDKAGTQAGYVGFADTGVKLLQMASFAGYNWQFTQAPVFATALGVASGGTGGTTPALARTGLGLATRLLDKGFANSGSAINISTGTLIGGARTGKIRAQIAFSTANSPYMRAIDSSGTPISSASYQYAGYYTGSDGTSALTNSGGGSATYVPIPYTVGVGGHTVMFDIEWFKNDGGQFNWLYKIVSMSSSGYPFHTTGGARLAFASNINGFTIGAGSGTITNARWISVGEDD